MLDLAISIDTDEKNTTVIETNKGVRLRAPGWPQDCDFQLVAFDASSGTSEVVDAESLADDIAEALAALDRAAVLGRRKPGWHRRLTRCAGRPPSSPA